MRVLLVAAAVLREMNELYQQCLAESRTLSKAGALLDDVTDTLTHDVISIDRLLYQCAIEMVIGRFVLCIEFYVLCSSVC